MTMKRKNWPVEKITSILQEAEAGMPVADLCRRYGMSDATYYNWKKKYGGMTVSEAKRLKELEEENLRLKRMVADLSLDNQILKDVNSKKW
jgi:putative transposase